jgi:hypothetical protein
MLAFGFDYFRITRKRNVDADSLDLPSLEQNASVFNHVARNGMKRCVAKDDWFLLGGTGNLIGGRCEADDQTQAALQCDSKQSLSYILIHGCDLPLLELVLA